MRTGLTCLGILLGVAVILAISVTNDLSETDVVLVRPGQGATVTRCVP